MLERDRFLEKITEEAITMSKSQRMIASYILDNITNLAFRTTKELSKEIGVSEASIVRFARYLGYSGYTEIQKIVQDSLLDKVPLVDVLQISSITSKDEVLSAVVKSEINRMERMLLPGFKDAYYRAVKAITEARNVYIAASRGTAAAANHFAFYLNYIRPNVKLLSQDCGDLIDQVLDCTEKDVMVIVGIARYTKRTIEIAKIGKKQGAQIIGITDTRISPIANESDIVLACEVSDRSRYWSPAAIFCLINAILQQIAISNKENTERRLGRLEQLLDMGDTYTSKKNK